MTYDDWKATPPCDNCGMTGCHLPGCRSLDDDDDFDAEGHVRPNAMDEDEEEAELCDARRDEGRGLA